MITIKEQKTSASFYLQKRGDICMCKRNGNPKRSSRFICLHCMKINELGSGIQRHGRTREKWHIKDLTCFNKGCQGIQTKNLEVRWCDDFLEALDMAEQIRSKYYPETENNNRKVG